MKTKNDCQVDYIKEAFDKLYTSVMPYIDLTQFADARTAFNELDKKVHGEIHILKKELEQYKKNNVRQRADIDGLEKEINDLKKRIYWLEGENANLRITPPDANAIEVLEKENSELKTSNERLNTKCKIGWKALFEAKADVTRYKRDNIRLRADIDALEKEIDTLKKKIQDLEEENSSLDEDVDALVAENADLHERLSSVEKSNGILRGDNETLYARLKGRDLDIFKRPWHGDANARTCHKSLVETVEELEAEKKARLEEKVDLSYGHDFKFGDEVFVPWSCEPYMYVIRGRLYNPRTENLVYVSGTEHLKWFGDKFSIV